MTRIRIKSALVLIPALMMASSLHAAEPVTEPVISSAPELTRTYVPAGLHAEIPQSLNSDQATLISVTNNSDNALANFNVTKAAMCAMELMPAARNIFYEVSPKVDTDSNLRKLIKKEVKPKVFSGKLSVKNAKKSAEEASICLKLLKNRDQNL